MSDCIVCKRITPKTVFELSHKLFGDKAHEIAKESVEIINQLDKEDRQFFCGQNKYHIVAGLFYGLAKKYDIVLSQRTIADVFPKAQQKENCQETMDYQSVGKSYKRWISKHQEFFVNCVQKDGDPK